jgi:hypothetical protein
MFESVVADQARERKAGRNRSDARHFGDLPEQWIVLGEKVRVWIGDALLEVSRPDDLYVPSWA